MTSQGPLFTERYDVLQEDIVNPRSCEVGCCNNRIALKFGRDLGSIAAGASFKFQSNWNCLNSNSAASRLHAILR